MKSKGFTLIEIIAVIIILGILMIITIPSISNFISDSRNSAYHSHEKSMEEAAKSYTIDCIKNNEQNCLIPREGEEITLLLSELENKDFLDKLQDPAKQGTYCNPEESYVKVRKNDKVDFDYTACLYCGSYSTENLKCFKIEVTPTTIQCGTDIIGAGESWTKEPRTISINCVDTGNSCKQERFEKTFGTTMEYGDITIYDMNPSRGTKSCRVPVRIDLEKPTCSLDVTGDKRSGYYVDDVTVSMPSSSRKDNHSGVGAFGIGTSSNNPKYDNKESITVSSNGITRVFGYIKDIVGNEGICSTSITKVGKYYIIYDKNTGNGSMEDTECIFGENCKLRKNTFTKTGYHFNYWSLLSNGNTAKHYSDEETVKNLTFSDKVRIYAIWEINQNTLTVNANSGTGGFSAITQNYNTTKAINVSRTGYTFTGWTPSGTCGSYTNEARTTYTFPANKDTSCTLKANWQIHTSKLVVDANGGTGGFGAVTQNYNTTKEIKVSRTGYTFDGWEASGTCGTYTNAASTTYTFPANKDTSCTLKANWKINTSKLAVDANDGLGGFSAITQNYNTTKEVSVSRTGHTFTSWTATGTCGTYTNTARTTYTFPANNGTTCTLKANWQIHTSKLVVDANDGSGGFGAVTQNYNTTKDISVSRTGYTFTGWTASGTCGNYNNTARTTYTYPANDGTSCTLTAGWRINTSSLVVDANGGSGSVSSTTQNYNTTKEINVSRTNYTFTSWTASGTCGSYNNTASTTYTYPTNDGTTCTLKANWKINKVDPTCPTLTSTNVVYDGNDHTIGVAGGSGGTIEYSTNASSWSRTNPKRKDYGSQTTYVRIVGDASHFDKNCGNATITIKRAGYITITRAASTEDSSNNVYSTNYPVFRDDDYRGVYAMYNKTSSTPITCHNMSTIKCTSGNTGVATCSISNGRLYVVGKSRGKTSITITCDANTDYTAASVSYPFYGWQWGPELTGLTDMDNCIDNCVNTCNSKFGSYPWGYHCGNSTVDYHPPRNNNGPTCSCFW